MVVTCAVEPSRHGRRGAFSGAPAAVLRAGIVSLGCVDGSGAVYLVGASPPARFGRPVMAAPPYALCCVTDERDRLSVRERIVRFVIF